MIEVKKKLEKIEGEWEVVKGGGKNREREEKRERGYIPNWLSRHPWK